MPRKYYDRILIPNKIENMSCLRFLRLKGDIDAKLLNSIVKPKCLETIDIENSGIELPCGVWESKQLRHLRYGRSRQASNGWCSISPFCRNIFSLPPNNVQTLMWLDDTLFEPRLLHRLINLRKLGIEKVFDSIVKILSTLSPVPKALEVLKLRFSYPINMDMMSEKINLSSYPNIVKLYLECRLIPLNSDEAFPPNLVKLTLNRFMVGVHVVAVLKKLPKLRILKMVWCSHNEEKMDLSGDGDGDSFPQLEVLHIQESNGLYEVTYRDDVSMPKLKNLLLLQRRGNVRLSERLAKLMRV